MTVREGLRITDCNFSVGCGLQIVFFVTFAVEMKATVVINLINSVVQLPGWRGRLEKLNPRARVSFRS